MSSSAIAEVEVQIKKHRPNRLVHETSPYLLQHAYNPVDWHPWGDEAFAEAVRTDKPVFLSIGYSTCHWCHVMERECFENEEIAALLNDSFICIKVDREERPDVDSYYMGSLTMLSGSGGWPLSAFLNHARKPFLLATYIPPHSKFQRKGLPDLTAEIMQVWRNERTQIDESAESISSHFAKSLLSSQQSEFGEDLLDHACNHYLQTFDAQHGGFQTRMKFPTPHNYIFLIQSYLRLRDPMLMNIVAFTLHKMRRGGIFDQAGFGFHRYSVDPEWKLPHFEKMLYDQAMLLMLYAEAYACFREPLFRQTALEIVEYARRQLRSGDGLFYSSEDADSEGEEGKFYLLAKSEVHNIHGDAEAKDFCRVFGIEEGGNFFEEATGHKTGTNILHGFDTYNPAEEKLQAMLKRVFEYREQRVRPLMDTKVILEWNAMFGAALAKAARLFSDGELEMMALRLHDAIESRFFGDDRLNAKARTYKDEQFKGAAVLEDYAFWLLFKLELYELTWKAELLDDAFSLAEVAISRFYDPVDGKFYQTPSETTELPHRIKEFYDGATPSGFSTMVLCLVKLAKISGSAKLEEICRKAFTATAAELQAYPSGHAQALTALTHFLRPSSVAVVASEQASDVASEIIKHIRTAYLPFTFPVLLTAGNHSQLSTLMPFLSGIRPEKSPKIYVCQDGQCQLPVETLAELSNILPSHCA